MNKDSKISNLKISSNWSNNLKIPLPLIFLSNIISGLLKLIDKCLWNNFIQSMIFIRLNKVSKVFKKISFLLSFLPSKAWRENCKNLMMNCWWENKWEKAGKRFPSDFGESTVKKLKNIGLNTLSKVLISLVYGSVPTFWRILLTNMWKRKWKLMSNNKPKKEKWNIGKVEKLGTMDFKDDVWLDMLTKSLKKNQSQKNRKNFIQKKIWNVVDLTSGQENRKEWT